MFIQIQIKKLKGVGAIIILTHQFETYRSVHFTDHIVQVPTNIDSPVW